MLVDILNIQPQVISRDLRSKFLLLAGPPKIGKTEFCTMAPDALILAFEVGTNARPGAMVQKIDTWSTFKLVLRQLDKPEAKEKFSTICVDTVGIAYDLCEKFICAQAGVQKIGDIPYGGRRITAALYSNVVSNKVVKIWNPEMGIRAEVLV